MPKIGSITNLNPQKSHFYCSPSASLSCVATSAFLLRFFVESSTSIVGYHLSSNTLWYTLSEIYSISEIKRRNWKWSPLPRLCFFQLLNKMVLVQSRKIWPGLVDLCRRFIYPNLPTSTARWESFLLLPFQPKLQSYQYHKYSISVFHQGLSFQGRRVEPMPQPITGQKPFQPIPGAFSPWCCNQLGDHLRMPWKTVWFLSRSTEMVRVHALWVTPHSTPGQSMRYPGTRWKYMKMLHPKNLWMCRRQTETGWMSYRNRPS